MRLIRFFLTLLVAVILSSSAAQAKSDDHDFRSLTYEEMKTFYPLVCDDYYTGMEEVHSCDRLLVHTDATPVADPAGRVSMKFTSIAHGSFTKAGADEVFILFWSNLGGEVGRGLGSIVFERQKSKWKLVDFELGPVDECVIVPGVAQQRILCIDAPEMCCMSRIGDVGLITWTTTPLEEQGQKILSYSGGLVDHGAEEENFCKMGNASSAHLTFVNQLKRSSEPGILAEARIEYLTPNEIQRACAEKKPNEAKPIQGRVLFKMDGDKVKAILPDGVSPPN